LSFAIIHSSPSFLNYNTKHPLRGLKSKGIIPAKDYNISQYLNIANRP
jgi:hypothetical protein